jgi:hypothetical protein
LVAIAHDELRCNCHDLYLLIFDEIAVSADRTITVQLADTARLMPVLTLPARSGG